jgi:SET domain-containing protein
MEGGAVGHNFERDPPKNHPCQVWLNSVQGFQRRRFKCESYDGRMPSDRPGELKSTRTNVS